MGQYMEFFVLDEEVRRQEQALPALRGQARLHGLTELAWHLRQRDSRRSLVLLEQAHTLWPACPPEALPLLQARALLIQSEIHLLFADLDAAWQDSEAALQLLLADDQPCALADTFYLRGYIASEQGKSEQRDALWQTGLQIASHGADPVRLALVQARVAIRAAYKDPAKAQADWQAPLQPDRHDRFLARRAEAHDFCGLVDSLTGQPGSSIMHLSQAFDLCQQLGNLRRAIVLSCNIGDAFNELNDHQNAAEWLQKGLALARPTGWPRLTGFCLSQMGETLRRLGRLAAAQQFLDDAFAALATLPHSETYAVTVLYQSDVYLDSRAYPQALASFDQLQHLARRLHRGDLEMSAWRGQAEALFHMHQVPAAISAATSALSLAESSLDKKEQISALQVLAMIHGRPQSTKTPGAGTGAGTGAVTGAGAAHAALDCLLRAQQIAAGIDGFLMPPDLLTDLAQAYAATGEHQPALDAAMAANLARTELHHHETDNRVLAMQLTWQVERTRAELAHQRQLAEAESMRASLLQQNSQTLENLGLIGQEITTHLHPQAVFEALYRHVRALLDVYSMDIYLLDADGLALNGQFSMENDQKVAPVSFPLSDSGRSSVLCVRERREILLDVDPVHPDDRLVPGTANTLSRLFAPLMAGAEVMGVMTVQALRRQAYGERERLIFRTLCAYGAIALDNAHAYQELAHTQSALQQSNLALTHSLADLQRTQAQLVQAEKMAALGALVAGVAHEINTPLGTTVMAISGVAAALQQLATSLANSDPMQRDCQTHLDEAHEYLHLAERSAARAAGLVSQFKEIAADFSDEPPSQIDLADFLGALCTDVRARLAEHDHRLTLQVAPGLRLVTGARALAEALSRILSNVADHAFANDYPAGEGRLEVDAVRQSDRGTGTGTGQIMLTLRDNGNGIAAAHLPKLFDPFFTTRSGEGDHAGLGLHVAYNQITQHLQGRIEIASQPGSGTTVTLWLPEQAELKRPN
jgi:signal transduction histidine kinase